MYRTARARINLAALRHNFNEARRFAGRSKVMGVIKANAYGHGLLETADALHEADGFAVACVDEAVALRRHGVTQPVSVFQGFADERELAACAEFALWPVLHDITQLTMLEAHTGARPSDVWVKLTTGMNRLGFRSDRAGDLARRLGALDGIRNVRLMTHMARADEGPAGEAPSGNGAHDDFTGTQITRFTADTAGLKCERSLANSAALVAWPESRAEWVRPGIMLYGASPFLPGQAARQLLDLKPVMTLSSRLIAVNSARKADPIGYGGTWRCPEDMPVGVVAVGYGDGYPRGIDASAEVLVGGCRAPIVGRVSMDLLTIDLRGVDAAVGDEVVLWGEGLPVDDIAESAGTIAYELLCGVYGRVRYRYDG